MSAHRSTLDGIIVAAMIFGGYYFLSKFAATICELVIEYREKRRTLKRTAVAEPSRRG